MINRPLWQPLWRPLWGMQIGNRVLAMLVDSTTGNALVAPDGSAWVRWITVS